MKTMSEMIKLMESVMDVPGLGNTEANMQAAGTVGRDSAYANFDASQNLEEKTPPGMEDMMHKLKAEYPGDKSAAYATAWSIYNKKHGKANESVPAINSCNQKNPMNADQACAMEESMGNPEVDAAMAQFENLVMNSYVEPEVAYDKICATLDPDTAAAFRAALMQHGEDMQAQAEAEPFDANMEEDLNNGYHDRHIARGSDYFPNGADGPVVNATGPSGARQGDNPEQKKMQVAETHKELVYAYRKYLKESAQTKKV